MANMTIGDRNQMERATIGDETTFRPRDGSKRGQTVYFVIGLAILAALSYAAIEAIHGWDHIIIIADLVILTLAVAAFAYNRQTRSIE